ncbi:tetratricopeptide repeat protein [Polyangium aurulentum]|uniref:tetratricopeptide repeat protein n=1 Tax=Polyangium aurulentum TaxID=2567896 RepID=UPI0010AE5276|nr:tetratricopeptide repeat protein [Polyangium aurulentum]UQA59653.1 tetratricopeptide repeat protein [Polyangium aurulentum]
MRTHRSFSFAARLTAALVVATVAGCGSPQTPQANCPELRAPDASIGGDLSGRGSVSADADANASARANADATAEVPPTAAELREAAELRARAKVNVDAGKLREALPDLERAFELSRDVTLLGDLGLALQAAGRLDEAWIALNRFRLEARAQYEPVRAKIDAALGDLQKQLGGLIVEADTPDAQLWVRGKLAARLPMASPIYLLPGDVSVVVRARGKADATIRARIALGEVARARANLPDLSLGAGGVGVGGIGAGGLGAGLGTPDLPPVQPPPTPSVWPWVLGIGGVVVVGGAIVASVVHVNKLDAFDANLCDGPGASPECPAIKSGIKVTTGLQVAGYILGGAALTTGIVVFALASSAPSVSGPSLDCPKTGCVRPPPVLQCGPRMGGGAMGFGCGGTF